MELDLECEYENYKYECSISIFLKMITKVIILFSDKWNEIFEAWDCQLKKIDMIINKWLQNKKKWTITTNKTFTFEFDNNFPTENESFTWFKQ